MSQRPPRRGSGRMIPIGEIVPEVMRGIIQRAIEAGNPPPQTILMRFVPPPVSKDSPPLAPTSPFR